MSENSKLPARDSLSSKADKAQARKAAGTKGKKKQEHVKAKVHHSLVVCGR